MGAWLCHRGARALVYKEFVELAVERITANNTAVNSRSRRVMEKSDLSFVQNFTGDWPEAIAGSEHGEVKYELTGTAQSPPASAIQWNAARNTFGALPEAGFLVSA